MNVVEVATILHVNVLAICLFLLFIEMMAKICPGFWVSNVF